MSPLAEPAGPRLTLSRRLAAALVVLTAALAAVLFLVVAPVARGAFAGLNAANARDDEATLRALAGQQTAAMRTVLVDLIHHTSQARSRVLHDLPLEALGGDVAAIRAAVLAEDAERSARQQHNVEQLAAEMERRADTTIAARLRELADKQRERGERMLGNLQWTHLGLVLVTLLGLLLVLGFGLHRFVVRPTLRLQQATRRVADGELAVDLPAPGPDELGDLTRAFATMVGQLQTSRARLQESADGLEREVGRKTAHLEQALVDLRASHLQLAQAERLASLGTLAGGVAHEFHNVIGGIRGCASDLLADEQDAGRRETLEVVVRAADRGAGIVHQLLRFARHPLGQRRTLAAATLVDEALRLCDAAARRQRVTVERSVPPDLVVHGDADGLHQVFVNLIVNALHAMPDGGTLRIAGTTDGAGVTLQVVDTGVGIAAEHLPHVFEPFFTTRADRVEAGHRGTGLGLAVSHGIVAAHGGRIEVRSMPGHGATFTVHLPAAGSGSGTTPAPP